MTHGAVETATITRTPDLAAFEQLAAQAAHRVRTDHVVFALRLVPRQPRSMLLRVCRYAQFVEAVGTTAAGDRRRQLELLALDLRAAPSGRARIAPIRALAPDLAYGRLSLAPLLTLIEASRQDQTVRSYPTFDDFALHCQLAAAPIGHVVLQAAQEVNQQNLVAADRIGAALGILRRCQDVGADARAGRVYLPADDLRAAGLTIAALRSAHTADALREVVADQVGRAVRMLRAGETVTGRLSGWPRLTFAMFVSAGRATADALGRADYDVLHRCVKPQHLRAARRAVPLAVGRPPR